MWLNMVEWWVVVYMQGLWCLGLSVFFFFILEEGVFELKCNTTVKLDPLLGDLVFVLNCYPCQRQQQLPEMVRKPPGK